MRVEDMADALDEAMAEVRQIEHHIRLTPPPCVESALVFNSSKVNTFQAHRFFKLALNPPAHPYWFQNVNPRTPTPRRCRSR